MTDPNANILSLSLPTDFLTGASTGGAGLSLNYNFGPNVDAVAQGAYSFLGSSINGAKAFEGASITGTQKFLSDQINPIVTSVAAEQQNYFAQLLGAFGTSYAAQQSVAQQSIGAEQQVANASIRSSSKSAKGGSLLNSIFGGCFITTAVCKYSGLPDDCDTLQTLRAWRDGWMQETAERRAMVEAYYRDAPVYVAKIEALPEREQKVIWDALRYLIGAACLHIRSVHMSGIGAEAHNRIALAYYLAAVEFARTASEHIA